MPTIDESDHDVEVEEKSESIVSSSFHDISNHNGSSHGISEEGSLKTTLNSNDEFDIKKIVMNLTDGDISDIHDLVNSTVIADISDIVGFDGCGKKLTVPKIHGLDEYRQHKKGQSKLTNVELIEQGKTWAKHIKEPWQITVIVGIYLFFSVGFGLPLFSVMANVILHIIRKFLGADVAVGSKAEISFSPIYPSIYMNQPFYITLIGFLVQLLDAFWYIYLTKTFTYGFRWLDGRPTSARMGKRTLVIVDNPCMHQLLESFVSKLFAQSYGFVSIDVHGASGLDHFVHRFTHRVARGVLIAVGRPDGRLSCLCKLK
jgi:hypothetical protein